MNFDDAVMVMGMLERRFVSADVVIRSTRVPLGRKYLVEAELEAAPVRDLGQLGEFNDELEQCDIETLATVTGSAGRVTLTVT